MHAVWLPGDVLLVTAYATEQCLGTCVVMALLLVLNAAIRQGLDGQERAGHPDGAQAGPRSIGRPTRMLFAIAPLPSRRLLCLAPDHPGLVAACLLGFVVLDNCCPNYDTGALYRSSTGTRRR